MAYCGECGNKLGELVKYCNKCGSPVIGDGTDTSKSLSELSQVSKSSFKPASSSRRLLNYLIDLPCYTGTAFLLVMFLYMLGLVTDEVSAFLEWVIIASSIILYYFITEYLWGKSIGKFFTKTKVISDDGSELTGSQVFKRSLIRLVPLEAFSFYGQNPVGWHDKWAGTRVVEEH